MKRSVGTAVGLLLLATSLTAQVLQERVAKEDSPATPSPAGTPKRPDIPHVKTTPPRAVYSPEPDYTKRARKAKIEGTVALSLVVDREGRAQDVKVVKRLAPDLDQNALATVKTWRFVPGSKDGQPMEVRLTVEIDFKLH